MKVDFNGGFGPHPFPDWRLKMKYEIIKKDKGTHPYHIVFDGCVDVAHAVTREAAEIILAALVAANYEVADD
jgi:hypothetical protein